MDRHADLSFTGTTFEFADPFEFNGEPHDLRIPYCFLHIPKTGGTTVHFVLKAALQDLIQNGEASYERFRVPRTEGKSPIAIEPGWTGSWTEVRARAMGLKPPGPRSFFSAHCPYGFHESLGLINAQYFTLVRDPVERELSSFNFQYQRGFLSPSTSLSEMLDRGLVLDNPQVRMLAGIDAMSGPCSEATYQRALYNLQERIPLAASDQEVLSFTRALLGFFKLPAVAFVRSQVTGIKLIDQADPGLQAKLSRYHSYDHRLVQYVTDRWEAWSSANLSPGRPVELDEEVLTVGPHFTAERKAKLVRRKDLSPRAQSDETLVPQVAVSERPNNLT